MYSIIHISREPFEFVTGFHDSLVLVLIRPLVVKDEKSSYPKKSATLARKLEQIAADRNITAGLKQNSDGGNAMN